MPATPIFVCACLGRSVDGARSRSNVRCKSISIASPIVKRCPHRWIDRPSTNSSRTPQCTRTDARAYVHSARARLSRARFSNAQRLSLQRTPQLGLLWPLGHQDARPHALSCPSWVRIDRFDRRPCLNLGLGATNHALQSRPPTPNRPGPQEQTTHGPCPPPSFIIDPTPTTPRTHTHTHKTGPAINQPCAPPCSWAAAS